jgi:hypothetical protein
MNNVNVAVNEYQVTVTDDATASSTVISATSIETVTALTSGPQGPPGLGLALNESAKVDKSLVYYDFPSQQFKADANVTAFTLTDGGNF